MKRLLAVAVASLFSATVWSSDLLDVYRDALVNDPQYAAARAEFEAGREFAVQGRAGLLPNIEAVGDVSRNRFDPDGARSQTFTTDNFGVELRQPIYRRQNWIVADQGALQTELSGVQFGLAHQDLILRVSEAYFNVLNAQDNLDAVTQLRTAAQEQREIAETSFEVGTVTITDVYEAQSRYDLAVARVIAAESELELNRHNLARIIGREPDQLVGLRSGIVVNPPSPNRSDEWVAAAQTGAFGVQTQQIVREIATREVERTRAGHYPTLDLVASQGWPNRQSGGVSSSTNRSSDTRVGVVLRLPIFEGGAITSREREAAALLVKADSDLENARRNAAFAARDAYLGVSSGLAEIAALEAAEVSSLSSVEANRLGYEVGVRINIDVLDALTQLAETRLSLASARYNTVLSHLRLNAAAGTLGQDDLQTVNALLGE
ncbi:TolC family outer membrane protein [Rhodocyclaceae bacterium SMB388]